MDEFVMNQIENEPCNCEPGFCKKRVVPAERCVHWLARNHKMELKWCNKCKAYVWHKDNDCCRCLYEKEDG